jgi:hypothetical protein
VRYAYYRFEQIKRTTMSRRISVASLFLPRVIYNARASSVPQAIYPKADRSHVCGGQNFVGLFLRRPLVAKAYNSSDGTDP